VSIVVDAFENDNRMARMAMSLAERHEVVVVGFVRGNLKERESLGQASVSRIRLTNWPSGKFFNLFRLGEYALRAVIRHRRADIWHCNDFEAFAIGCLARMTRPSLKLVYDCHEYETERYFLRGWRKRFVKFWERRLIRFADAVITVSPGIMREYERLYGRLNIHLVRNTPHLREMISSRVLRDKFGIRDDQRIFLYQGMISGGRGIEVLLEAFEDMPDDRCVLVIMGFGKLEHLVKAKADRSPIIFFHPAVPYSEINRYSGSADVGLNTPQNHCLSYYYCLPNKLFEYIQSGIPVLTNNLPDCRTLVEQERVGEVIEEFTPDGVRQAVRQMADADLGLYRENLISARERHHWDEEVNRLFAVYSSVGA
jgi:glycosyltransferase involved in cell wall biosynthesis